MTPNGATDDAAPDKQVRRRDVAPVSLPPGGGLLRGPGPRRSALLCPARAGACCPALENPSTTVHRLSLPAQPKRLPWRDVV